MATTAKPAATTTELPEIAEQVRTQLLSVVAQGQQATLEATRAYAKTLSALPAPELPTIPGTASLPTIDAVTTYAFDLAAELLASQRAFTLQLAEILTPAKAA